MVDWLAFSQLWKLQVQAQGTGRVGFWWTLSPWLADGTFLQKTMSSHGLSSVHTDPWCLCLLYKDTSVLGLGPCPYDLIQFLSLPRPYLQL